MLDTESQCAAALRMGMGRVRATQIKWCVPHSQSKQVTAQSTADYQVLRSCNITPTSAPAGADHTACSSDEGWFTQSDHCGYSAPWRLFSSLLSHTEQTPWFN